MQANVSRTLIAAVIVILSSAGPVMAGSQRFEIPADRAATDVLPASVLSGPHYRIGGTVVSHGYMNTWTVVSDYGTFRVTGDGALRKLVREIQAITGLKEISQTEAFLGAVKRSATDPVRFAGNLIDDPVDTISGIPDGVFRVFENVAQGLNMQHDPSEDTKLEQALSVSSWKRDYAAEWSVDPYSSNKVLQEEMNRVAWAATIGGLSLSAALTPLQGPTGLAYKNTRFAQQIRGTLEQEPPSRLRIINKQKLLAMGVSSKLADQFLDHPAFTPRHDTVIVDALAALGPAKGRAEFIRSVLTATDEVAANFYMNVAETMKGYNDTQSMIQEIVVVSGLTFARAANGRTLIPFPLDYGLWTKRVSELVPRLIAVAEAKGIHGGYDLWIAGALSPLARENFAKLGFRPTENVAQTIGFVD